MIKLFEKPTIHKDCLITNSELGEWTEIGEKSVIDQTAIGDYTYLAGFNQVNYSRIGKFCSIATYVRLNPGNHPSNRVTQHHMTYRRQMFDLMDTDDEAFFAWRQTHQVVVGHDVWLGHNVCVMPGVNIGNGAVVGSGAIVTKDIEPYTINVGVPAKPIKRRFDKTIAAALEEIRWWDWSNDMLKEKILDFNDIEAFVAKYR
jgi:phosphonate metabolism protein (transferase hexapeptide repeat family)